MDVSSKTDVLTPKAPVADGTYDLVVSLGANCSAAAQLRIRGLRHVALPFDWLYVVDERPFVWLADHVSDNWSGLCLKENLSEITPDHPEWNSEHLDRVKYVDAESGYRLVNHFNVSIDNVEEYLRVYGTLRRRIERLVSICQGGGISSFCWRQKSVCKRRPLRTCCRRFSAGSRQRISRFAICTSELANPGTATAAPSTYRRLDVTRIDTISSRPILSGHSLTRFGSGMWCKSLLRRPMTSVGVVVCRRQSRWACRMGL